jgi:hypothetical protein
MYENLPLYDCHKKVRAAKIIDRDNDVLVLEIPGIESATFKVTVDDEYLSRCPKLAVGGKGWPSQKRKSIRSASTAT